MRALGEEQAGRVRHFHEPALLHLEDPDLVRRPEAILHRPQHTVGVMALALEVQHRVDEMLEDAGAGDGALLGDVTDEERGDARALGQRHQARAALAHLGDAAGRRLQVGQEHGLDGVDDERPRLEVVDGGLDGPEVTLRPQEQTIGGHPQALGAQLDLRGGLFRRDVEDGRRGLRQRPRGLEQQRALADAGIAADEHERARHDASAEHPVELADAGPAALGVVQRDIAQETRTARRRHAAPPGGRGRRTLLDQDDELAGGALAVRTGARLRGREPALLAAIDAALPRAHGLPSLLAPPSLPRPRIR